MLVNSNSGGKGVRKLVSSKIASATRKKENGKSWRRLEDKEQEAGQIVMTLPKQSSSQGGVQNPFSMTRDHENFPPFDTAMDDSIGNKDGGSGLDDDYDDEDDQDISGDSFIPLNLSIGGLAAFDGNQDFGVHHRRPCSTRLGR